ncbi:MAG: translocation/assembly module TamB domain-containing protein [Treponema sp.]|jgi:hypothetical protein|nr:translocation/assembly module TamB domain-containing protein [Treponema sp.]
MKENRLTRIISNILMFLVLITLTVLLLRPLQKELFAKMTALRNELIARGEAFLGMRIEYSSVGPSLFSNLDIRGIGIYGSAPDPLLSLARLRISFSLLGILQGKGLGALKVIRLDKPVVSLDFDHAGDWEALLAKIGKQEDGVSGPPPSGESSGNWLTGLSGDISLRIRGGEGKLLMGGNRFSLSGNLDAAIRGNRISVKGKADGKAFLEAFLGRSMTMGMSGRFNGELDTRLREGKLALVISSLAGDGFSFRTLQFGVSLDSEKVEVHKTGDESPGNENSLELSLGYAFNTQRFFGRFEGRDFIPRLFLSLRSPWEEYNAILGLSVNGTASFEAGVQDGVSYTADLSGDLGEIFPIDDVSYAVAVTGTGESANFRRLALRFPQGDIEYTGRLDLKTLSPDGRIAVKDFSLAPVVNSGDAEGEAGGNLINANLRVMPYGRTITIFGDGVLMGPVFFTALDADIQREDQGLTFKFSVLRFVGAEAYEEGRLSSLAVEGSLDYAPRHLQASIILDAFPLDDIFYMLRPLAIVSALPEPVSRFTADTSITTEVFVTTDFDQILYNAPRFVLAYQGQREFFALASISGTDRHFELNESRIALSGSAAEVSGYLDFYNPNDITFSLMASYQNMSYYFEGALLDQRSLSIQGSYGLSIYITRTPSGGYSGYAEAVSIPIPVKMGQFFRLNFLSSLRYNAPESWSVDLSRLEISELATPASPSTSLRLSGRADQNGVSFHNVVFDDGLGILFGQATVFWHGDLETGQELPESEPRSEPEPAAGTESDRLLITLFLRLADGQGHETYNLEGIYEEGVVELRLTGQEMQLGRVSNTVLNAVATGEGRLHWTVGGAYEVTAVLSSLTAQYNENLITLSAQGSLTEDEMTIRDLRVNYGNLEAALSLFRLSHQDSVVWVQGRFQGIAVGRRIDGAFTGEAGIEPFESWLTLGDALDSFSGALQVERIRLDTQERTEPFHLVFSRSESSISLTGGPQDMIRFRITNEGAFYAGLSSPSPIRGAAVGTIASNMIDAHATNLYVDLAALGSLLPYKDVVALTGGLVNASVDIRGPLGDPEFFGIAQGHSVRLEIPQYLGAEIGPVPITVILDGNEMRFGPINVPAGKGYGVVSGWFRFDRWVPNTFSIDIDSSLEYPVPFDFEILGIVAHGGASGSMNVSMENSQLRLSGDLVGEDTEIVLDAQGISAAMNQDSSDTLAVLTDFTLTMGRKVEFFWPTADYPLLQASAIAGMGIKITSDSETGRFSVTGDIGLRSGSLFYGQRNFYIRQGTLFFNENEIQFDPRLTIRAETQDRNNDGPVTIFMIVDNAPLMSFTARFETSPPLSQIEILSLMGQTLTGLPEEGGEGGRVQNIVFSGVDFLSQSFVFRRLERLIRNFTGLDMFTFWSPIVRNFITSQWNPIDNDERGNYFDNTAVFIGKYFSSDMFFQGSVLLQYDENRLEMGGYTFEADLGIELHSPLFDIRWNVSPLKYQTFFDASFTLTWRWLF